MHAAIMLYVFTMLAMKYEHIAFSSHMLLNNSA